MALTPATSPAVAPATTTPPAIVAKDTTIPAGKTFLLLNGTKVELLKSVTAEMRVYTNWTVYTYADQPTALADITAKGWSYTAPKA